MSESNRRVLKVSVRELVAFALRGGDLHQHQYGAITAIEGIRGHQRLQESRGDDYESEVTVRRTYEKDDVEVLISGRIDGVFPKRNPVVVEEIKTTRRPFDEVAPNAEELHLAQAKMYACLYVHQQELAGATVQLTYFNVDSGRTSSQREYADASELEAFFEDIVGLYMAWAQLLHEWESIRNQQAIDLAFPFDDYRAGQRHFAIGTYRTLRDGGLLFAQAPTGIGKTMGALYPAFKALAEGHVRKLFFLTAKTNGAQMAEKALHLLRGKGLAAKSVCITAKDRICFDAPCNQETCPYAVGYYDRLRPALVATFGEQHFNKERIEAMAQEFQLCPFEFSLDLALYADVVICDYNYAFDPGAYLRRFFNGEAEGHVLLIDEAHNLVDRSRDMYSAEISKRTLLDVAREVKPLLPDMAKAVNSVNRAMVKLRKMMDEKGEEEWVDQEPPQPILSSLNRFCQRFEHWLSEEQPEEVPSPLRELYFLVRRFLRSVDFYDEHFATIYRTDGRHLDLKVQCLDAAHLLAKFLETTAATVYFSATLTPFNFFTRLLGGNAESPRLNLPSPFPADHLGLLVCGDVSTKYKDRDQSLNRLVETIGTVIAGREGNYLVFFPSYRYLRKTLEVFQAKYPETPIQVQEPGMDNDARLDFLNAFETNLESTLVGFAVMGGAFGEGVDLVGDALIGVIVVGVGLPMVCIERNLMRNHFDTDGLPGFEFAYQFPGMNRVLQTAGRVIRDETDRGIVCLIDQRFAHGRYRALFPPWWQPHFTYNPEQLTSVLLDFWQRSEAELDS